MTRKFIVSLIIVIAVVVSATVAEAQYGRRGSNLGDYAKDIGAVAGSAVAGGAMEFGLQALDNSVTRGGIRRSNPTGIVIEDPTGEGLDCELLNPRKKDKVVSSTASSEGPCRINLDPTYTERGSSGSSYRNTNIGAYGYGGGVRPYVSAYVGGYGGAGSSVYATTRSATVRIQRKGQPAYVCEFSVPAGRTAFVADPESQCRDDGSQSTASQAGGYCAWYAQKGVKAQDC